MMRLALLIATTALCACTSQTQSIVPSTSSSDLQAESSISVKDPNFKPKPGQTVSWMQPLSWEGVASSPQTQEWAMFMTQTIEQELSLKNYQIVADSAPYQLLGFVVLGELSDHPDLEAIFRLYPDAGKSQSERQRGTLILALLPNSGSPSPTVQTAWRGAVQIFRAHLNELDSVNSEKRIELAIKDLISAIPAAPPK